MALKFSTSTDYLSGSNPFSVAIADLNGDGIPDLAVANSAAGGGTFSVSVLLGNGNGTFQYPITYANPANPFSIAIGDLNGDGKPDLAVTDTGSNTVGILLSNGDGTFQSQVTYATGASPISVAIGDLNGDIPAGDFGRPSAFDTQGRQRSYFASL